MKPAQIMAHLSDKLRETDPVPIVTNYRRNLIFVVGEIPSLCHRVALAALARGHKGECSDKTHSCSHHNNSFNEINNSRRNG